MTKTEILTALTFIALLAGIWIDSLWVKVPVTALIVLTIIGSIATSGRSKQNGNN